MKRLMMITALGMMTGSATLAVAASYDYMIDHGTPGVIASVSGKARLVLRADGDCSSVSYEVIADGVKSLSGSMDLTHELSLPLDLTTVTLSCAQEGIRAQIRR